MLNLFTNSIIDTVKDTAFLVPFLFITYLVMEWLEHRTEDQSVSLLSRMGPLGPVLGSALGIIPQCGFSAAASSLYSGGVISLGTLLAVFLSTSDEMLPIFISSGVSPALIGRILLIKFILAMITGLIIDMIFRLVRRGPRRDKHIHDLCEQDDCGCDDEEGGIVRSALIHTVKIAIFVFLVSLAISLLIALVGRGAITAFLVDIPVLGVLLAGLVGLIPNCAASVVIAELYLEGLLTTGQMMAGLLVGAGVGILVLLRSNRHQWENMGIILCLYGCGVLWGLLIDLLGISL